MNLGLYTVGMSFVYCCGEDVLCIYRRFDMQRNTGKLSNKYTYICFFIKSTGRTIRRYRVLNEQCIYYGVY